MKTPLFEGACTAIITPFCADGIDFPALERQLEFQLDNGIEAIVAAGTTGENATLDIHEYTQLIDSAVRKCSGKAKVIAGIGGNNSSACLKKARYAKEAGAHGVLMTPPYYNKTSAEGLVAHFLHVADNVDIPLVLYNVPSRTSIGFDFETYRILSKHPNINGTKEASGNVSLAAKLLTGLNDRFFVWSGNDDNVIALMSMGAKGLISVASNIIPSAISRICKLCLEGNFGTALEVFGKYHEVLEKLFIDVNPIPVKAAMKMLQTDRGQLRLPLTELAEPKQAKLKDALINAGLL